MKQLEIEKNPNFTLNPDLTEIEIREDDVLCLDLETNGDTCWRDKIRVIALLTKKEQYLLIPEYYNYIELGWLFKRIKKFNCLVIAHNAKFDVGFVYTHYKVLLENVWCTMLASQVYQGGIKTFRNSLDSCLKNYLGIEIENKKEMQESFLNDKPLTEAQLNYAAGDTKYLIPLKEKLEQLLAERGLEKVIKLENKLIPVLVKMEAHGCPIDVDKWKAKLKEWEIKKKEAIADLDAEVMRVYPYMLFANINYSSPKQVIGLFKNLGLPLPTTKDKKTKEEKTSVEEKVLDTYLNEHSDSPLKGFIEKMKVYKEYDKLLSTYGESFLERVDSNNRIHTKYSQCSTSTHRMASSEPNLNNIPSEKSGEGAEIREYFIAPPGYKMITCDMSGAEIVLAADFSKDDLLVRSIKEGADMHSELASISASIIYGQSVKISKSREPIKIGKITLVPEEFRNVHKSATFAKFYRGGPARVYDVLARYINPAVPAKKRMAVAKQISEAIDRALYKLSYWLDQQIKSANQNKYLVTTKLGRRRYFSGDVYGEAANAPIQGSNGDAIKIAMIKIDKFIGDKGQLVLSIYDEVVAVVKEDFAEEAAKFIEETMAQSLTWFLTDLKGSAKANIGNHWEK